MREEETKKEEKKSFEFVSSFHFRKKLDNSQSQVREVTKQIAELLCVQGISFFPAL